MTDPGAPAGNQQRPDSAGVPQAGGGADIPRDPADAPGQPEPGQEGAPCPEAGTSRFEVDDLVQHVDGIYDLAQQAKDITDTLAWAESALLESVTPAISIASAFPSTVLGGIADSLARTQSEFLASTVPKLIAGAFPDGGLMAPISGMAVFPDFGFLKNIPAAVFPVVSFPEPVIPRYVLPPLPDTGFRHAVSAMLSSWDHGLLGITRQFTENATALASRALIDSIARLPPIGAGLLAPLTDLAASVTSSLVGLFQSWRETAETGLEMLRGLARAAYRAACRARKAVLDGDDGPVAWFIEAWLGMRVTHLRIEAVSAALLEDGWDAEIPEDHDYLIADLRRRTRRQARVLRPLWDTQLNHQLIGTLDQAVTGRDGRPLAVADLVPAPQTTEALVLACECEEQRVSMVLGRLKPDERQVASLYAQRSGLTWAEAARLLGAADPAAKGDSVRRKLKRLGADHSRRMVQAAGA